MTVYAFVDTTVLMEFKPIREIDWKDLLSTTEEIVVTIAPAVTKELNNHKNGPNPQKRDRARGTCQRL